MKKRTVALLLACMMMIGVAAGGTIAWLTAQSKTVVNTFTIGKIAITLTEAQGTLSSDVDNVETRSFKFNPGETIPKDPIITVQAGSEASYLFVKVIEDFKGLDGLVAYTVDTSDGNWIQLKNGETPVAGVYYRQIGAAASDTPYKILTGGEVVASNSITVEQVNGLGAEVPSLTFQAAAIQSAQTGTAYEAFTKLPSAFTGISPTP